MDAGEAPALDVAGVLAMGMDEGGLQCFIFQSSFYYGDPCISLDGFGLDIF